MADIFYFSVEDKEASDEKWMFKIPLKDCLYFFDIRPWQRECGIDEFPNLITGDPLVDSGGYVHVLMKISEDEIQESGEGSYEPGWYKMNMTIIEVQSIIAEVRKNKEKKQPTSRQRKKK